MWSYTLDPRSKYFGTVFAGSLLLFGACFSAAGGLMIHSWFSHSGRADGIVIAVPRFRDGLYRAQVRFVAGGKTFEFRDSTGRSQPEYHVGDRIPVRYDPMLPGDDPQTGSTIYLGLGFLLSGLGVMVPALLYFLLRGPSRRETDPERRRLLFNRVLAVVMASGSGMAGLAMIVAPLVANRLVPGPPLDELDYSLMAGGVVVMGIGLYFARKGWRNELSAV